MWRIFGTYTRAEPSSAATSCHPPRSRAMRRSRRTSSDSRVLSTWPPSNPMITRRDSAISVFSLRGLDDLGQDGSGRRRVDEGDAGPADPGAGLLVDEPEAGATERGQHRVDV